MLNLSVIGTSGITEKFYPPRVKQDVSNFIMVDRGNTAAGRCFHSARL